MAPTLDSQVFSHVGLSDCPLSCLRVFALDILSTTSYSFSSFRLQHQLISSELLPLINFYNVPRPFSPLAFYCFFLYDSSQFIIICLPFNVYNSHGMVRSVRKSVWFAHSYILIYERVGLIGGTQEKLVTSMNG